MAAKKKKTGVKEFDSIAKLFEEVRSYKLEKKACVIAWGEYAGTMVGFAVADGPSQKWVIDRKVIKEALKNCQEDDERGWLKQMLSFQGRRELIVWLRKTK